jgi:hypothetical protein
VSIDRGLTDTGTGSDGFDPEHAVANVAKFIEGGLERSIRGSMVSVAGVVR